MNALFTTNAVNVGVRASLPEPEVIPFANRISGVCHNLQNCPAGYAVGKVLFLISAKIMAMRRAE